MGDMKKMEEEKKEEKSREINDKNERLGCRKKKIKVS